MKKKTVVVLMGVMTIVLAILITKQINYKKTEKGAISNIEVSSTEIQQYCEMIGNSMNIKKANIKLFKSMDEYNAYLQNKTGSYIEPKMESDEYGEYFNVVGSGELENVFDALEDGKTYDKPVMYMGYFTLIERIGEYNPIGTEDKLKEYIKEEKIRNQEVSDSD